jgi:gamma-glutamyltranspeptidase/glutathione hydrolase
MFTTRPEIAGDLGVVSSTHWLASTAALAVLEQGGNAVDAAVTGGFVLQVVEPHLNGPGGEVPILIGDAGGDVQVYCGQGPTPAAAHLSAFTDLGLDLVPGTGLLPAVVPGAFGAWTLLLQQRGTWRLRDVLAPAIGYAERGHPVLDGERRTIAAVAAMLRRNWPTSAAVYLPGGAVPSVGARLRNPALAATYRRIVAEGEAAGPDRDLQLDRARQSYYAGFVAAAIDRFCRTSDVPDSSGRAHRGLLTGDDLARWSPTVEATVHVDYQGMSVHKTRAWGQGPVFLQQLRLAEATGLAALPVGGAEWTHTLLEASKLAFADREAWYGDTDVPLETLLEPSYAQVRAALIGEDASFELRPGSPDGQEARIWSGHAADSASGAGEPTLAADLHTSPDGATRGDTCHLDVVDRWGTMVSATPSGGWLQSSPVIPELGFVLGTRGQMLWLQPGLAASMAPGIRPRITLSPTLVTRDGRPYLAFGTPGGDQQDQWSLQFFLRYVHSGCGVQAAIDAPTFHSTHFPSSFYPRDAQPGHAVVEGRFDPGVIAELRRRGHDVEVVADWALGRVCAVVDDRPNGFLRGGASPRGGQCYAIGR